MPRAANISNVERSFILEALQQGVRLDGRGLSDGRKVEIAFGDEYGIVTVRLGRTRSVSPYLQRITRLTLSEYLCKSRQK